MSQFICPRCSSTFFVLIPGNKETVFTLAEDFIITPITDSKEFKNLTQLSDEKIHCGACSWQGNRSELNESDLF